MTAKAGWRRWFPRHEVPKEIEALVKAGLLRDDTSKDDIVPHFETSFPDGTEIVLWVDHPSPESRITIGRFEIHVKEPGEHFVTLLETDDLEELLREIRRAFKVKGGPWPAE